MTIEDKTSVRDQLVGEGKKFKTDEDLAKGKLEADAFVASLTQETAELKRQLSEALKHADTTSALEKIMTEITKPTVTDDKTIAGSPTDKVNQTQTLSQDDIVKIIEAREVEKQAVRNHADALAKVQKVYGDKTAEVLAAKAANLGLSVDELTALARRSPSAFVTLVGANPSNPGTRSMASAGTVNSQAQDGPNPGVRNKAFYDAKMKEMGATKFVFDSKLQIQLHKDRMELGDEWEAA